MTQKRKTSQKKKDAYKKDMIQMSIYLLVIFFSILGLFSWGLIGEFFNGLFRVLFGNNPAVILPGIIFTFIILFFTVYMVKPKLITERPNRLWIGLGLLLLVLLIAYSFPRDESITGKYVILNFNPQVKDIFLHSNKDAGAGAFGAYLFALTSLLFGRNGTIVLNGILTIVATLLLISPSQWKNFSHKIALIFKRIFGFVKKIFNPSKEDVAEDTEDEEEIFVPEPQTFDAPQDETSTGGSIFISADDQIENEAILTHEDDQMKIDIDDQQEINHASKNDSSFGNYQRPPITLLEGGRRTGKNASNTKSARDKGKRIIEVMSQFGIEAELVDIHIGPSVTKFEIKPDSNVKINKILSIQDNMMMELAVTSLRIEAPIPGRPAVGIEIPNIEMTPVRLKEVISNTTDFFDEENINVALGKNLSGESISIALNKMPHLLIAGATGSGKSVCINSIISSLLLTKHPDDLKLILIDPKKVEFTPYVKIPHLIREVVTDPNLANVALQRVVAEMENRYEIFARVGVRNISGYNEWVKQDPQGDRKRMHWIVIIIDELADLMAVAGKEVETSIQRITQLARAAGIHLIVATQRPSVDVVTGVIKANIPSRIAFAVSSAVDSRTILDAVGADKLLGNGDMLYMPMGAPSPTRVQGVYVSDAEVNALTQYASEQGEPDFDTKFTNLDQPAEESSGPSLNDEDLKILEDAIEFAIENQSASTSRIQRQFRIGYNRAANIMDALEERGIVEPQQGSRARKVLFEDMESYLNSLKQED